MLRERSPQSLRRFETVCEIFLPMLPVLLPAVPGTQPVPVPAATPFLAPVAQFGPLSNGLPHLPAETRLQDRIQHHNAQPRHDSVHSSASMSVRSANRGHDRGRPGPPATKQLFRPVACKSEQTATLPQPNDAVVSRLSSDFHVKCQSPHHP